MLGQNTRRISFALILFAACFSCFMGNNRTVAGDRFPLKADEPFPIDLVEANKTLQQQLDSVLRINAQLEWQLQRLVVMNNRFADTVKEMKERNPEEKHTRKPMLMRYRRTRTGALIGELVQ
jgi:hypothetical protein